MLTNDMKRLIRRKFLKKQNLDYLKNLKVDMTLTELLYRPEFLLTSSMNKSL